MRLASPRPFALLLTFLAATLVHAAALGVPASGEGLAPPSWFCYCKQKSLHSHYVLDGQGWNKTEKEIKKAIAAAGAMTRWKFEEWTDAEGNSGFKSSVSYVVFSRALLFDLRARF